jgi:predicted metal-binding protein
MKRRNFSYIRHGNCLLFLLYLYITGRICAIYYKKEHIYSYHFVGLTRKNNIVHLTQRHIKKQKDYSPFFIIGRPEIIERNHFKLRNGFKIILGYDEHCERYFV